MHSPLSPAAAIRKLAAPLRQQVVDGLRQEIISGRLAPGARLTERELTALMGVSRTVVREALRQLETEGLVSTIPHKGPVVRALSLDEAKDLYAVRAVLEGFAARLFAERADEIQVQALAAALDRVAQAYEAGDTVGVLDHKNRFYEILVGGAGSDTLSAMLTALHARIWRWRALGLSHPARSPTRSRESIDNLRRVLEAIRRRDGESAERTTREEADQAAAEVTRLLAAA